MQLEPTYSVAELAAAIGRVVDRAFPDELWVQGEIRDLTRAPSGHVYFSLVDPDEDTDTTTPAMLPVTLFATEKVAVNRVLQRSGAGRFDDGIAVRIRGRLSHYGPRGTVQLRMLWIDTDYTLGKLAAERARIIQTLADEGLLERNGGLPFPMVPLRVALVTSVGSAAHADFMEELAGSGLAFDVDVFDTRVQGIDAAPSLIASIEAAGGAEVVAIVRGGGSRTDLAAFDREDVARAVALCPVPVVVGIGHEVDETVIDRVAARSYRTPTACAAGIVSAVAAYLRRLDATGVSITAAARRRLARTDRDLEVVAGRVTRSVIRSLRSAGAMLDTHRQRTITATDRALERAGRQTLMTAHRIGARAATLADHAGAQVEWTRSRLDAADRVLERAAARLDTLEAKVTGLDPRQVLSRGWTLTADATGRIIRDPATVGLGDHVTTVFAAGEMRSVVESVDVGHREPEDPRLQREEESK